MAAFAALAAAYPASVTLECAVPCERALDDGTRRARRRWCARPGSGSMPSSSRPRSTGSSTPPGSAWPDCPPLEDVYAAARRAFPGVRLGGGMLSYFTELNRKRVPADDLDFVTHCTCRSSMPPTTVSVMQSLEALPFITRSVRAIYGDKPYRIGPSTIAMRQNPYGSATKDNPTLSRIAMANRDPRHNALLGAAWAVGYAARTAPAGLEQLMLTALRRAVRRACRQRTSPSAGRRLEAARPCGRRRWRPWLAMQIAAASRRRQRARRPGRRLGGRQGPTRLMRQSDRRTPRQCDVSAVAPRRRRGSGPEFRNPCWRARWQAAEDRRAAGSRICHRLRRGAACLSANRHAVSSRRRASRARASAPDA